MTRNLQSALKRHKLRHSDDVDVAYMDDFLLLTLRGTLSQQGRLASYKIEHLVPSRSAPNAHYLTSSPRRIVSVIVFAAFA
ncbi:hypothetical protein [Ochrobactrum sp. BTU1]|jgi:hypothetical protein|uniref:hypothetical protein n=1 Tax=Ochrobactrum sp. BTU1 TaxID=2840456 RepID=UPI001C047C88|nr:hypothetical protein KMS41_17185 [Ochrobactrum sp. BTU1]GLU25440.1 hypothetical protein Brsp01_06730 [Brucella sp. NBRC 12950]